MLSLDLSRGQKLQLGLVLVIFTIAGFLVYRNTRPVSDMTITSWTKPKFLGLDPAKPISVNNPVDPNRNLLITVFACHDGQLEITESVNDPEVRPTFAFRPDLKRASYNFYKNPLEKIKAISDPCKQTLSHAAWYVAEGRMGQGVGLIAKSDLTPAQLKSEKELRREMLDNVDRIRQSARHGNYEPDLYESVLRALSDYRARDGDPTKDPAKAKLARKVLDLAMEFLSRQQKEEAVIIDKFVADLDALLTPEQKAKLAEAGKLATVQKPPRPGKNRAG